MHRVYNKCSVRCEVMWHYTEWAKKVNHLVFLKKSVLSDMSVKHIVPHKDKILDYYYRLLSQ